MQSLQQMRDEVKRLETEFKNVPQVVYPEKAPQNSRSKSPVHQNQEIQSMVDKVRQDHIRRE